MAAQISLLHPCHESSEMIFWNAISSVFLLSFSFSSATCFFRFGWRRTLYTPSFAFGGLTSSNSHSELLSKPHYLYTQDNVPSPSPTYHNHPFEGQAIQLKDAISMKSNVPHHSCREKSSVDMDNQEIG
ncbi:hypothetical protein Tco_1475296 [Tanacetum coccineum]